jgi:uncharacterized protein
MSERSISPFGKTRALVAQIDEFLDKLSEGGMVYARGLRAFLEDQSSVAEQKLAQLTALENRCDALRRTIEATLYTEMLIPESRSDVLHLLGELDDLLDGFKASLTEFVVERPEVRAEYRPDVLELSSLVVESCESAVRAARAFFRDVPAIRDHVHKTGYYEKESDIVALRLRKALFDSDMTLSQKMHLRDALEFLADIANAAEDCGDRLTIYAIKRHL